MALIIVCGPSADTLTTLVSGAAGSGFQSRLSPLLWRCARVTSGLKLACCSLCSIQLECFMTVSSTGQGPVPLNTSLL